MNNHYSFPQVNLNATWGYFNASNNFVDFAASTSYMINNSLSLNLPNFSVQENQKILNFLNFNGQLMYYDNTSNSYFEVKKKQAAANQSLPNPIFIPNQNFSIFSQTVQSPKPQPKNYVVWQWEDRESYQDYPREVCILIEDAYQKKQTEIIISNTSNGKTYKISFVNDVFLQTNVNTGHSIRVKRI